MAANKSLGLIIKSLLGISLVILIYLGYKTSVDSNVKINADTYYFYLPEKSTPMFVADSLKDRRVIKSRWSFRIVASIKGLKEIKPGMYELKKNWNNAELIRHFKTFQPKATTLINLPILQTRRGLINGICKGTTIVPEDLWAILNDKKFCSELGGFNKESIFSIFIPGSYRVYKKTSARELMNRLYQEYLLFWNYKRMELAKEMGLKRSEVYILSTIVYSETKLEEEMPIIAGVYLNRIRMNMRLESDPTLIYATKKFGTKRVMFKDKEVISPYNTYKHKGLPPGPICVVPDYVIDQVLEYEGHDYLYFCANPDLEGGHIFAETFEEHKENAQRYREKLDEENIY